MHGVQPQLRRPHQAKCKSKHIELTSTVGKYNFVPLPLKYGTLMLIRWQRQFEHFRIKPSLVNLKIWTCSPLQALLSNRGHRPTLNTLAETLIIRDISYCFIIHCFMENIQKLLCEMQDFICASKNTRTNAPIKAAASLENITHAHWAWYNLQILNNYWMRLSMISWITKTEVCVICWSWRLRQITQTWGFDNSWFQAKTEFNNCFIIHFSHNSSSETEAKHSAILFLRRTPQGA